MKAPTAQHTMVATTPPSGDSRPSASISYGHIGPAEVDDVRGTGCASDGVEDSSVERLAVRRITIDQWDEEFVANPDAAFATLGKIAVHMNVAAMAEGEESRWAIMVLKPNIGSSLGHANFITSTALVSKAVRHDDAEGLADLRACLDLPDGFHEQLWQASGPGIIVTVAGREFGPSNGEGPSVCAHVHIAVGPGQ